MHEINVKTHLIITDIHDEYDVNWCGRLMDLDPLFVDDCPVFVLVSSDTRMELNTFDLKRVEAAAKRIAHPKGRTAVTTDRTTIFMKEVDGAETKVGVVTKRHVKTFAPMYDAVGYRD